MALLEILPQPIQSIAYDWRRYSETEGWVTPDRVREIQLFNKHPKPSENKGGQMELKFSQEQIERAFIIEQWFKNGGAYAANRSQSIPSTSGERLGSDKRKDYYYSEQGICRINEHMGSKYPIPKPWVVIPTLDGFFGSVNCADYEDYPHSFMLCNSASGPIVADLTLAQFFKREKGDVLGVDYVLSKREEFEGHITTNQRHGFALVVGTPDQIYSTYGLEYNIKLPPDDWKFRYRNEAEGG